MTAEADQNETEQASCAPAAGSAATELAELRRDKARLEWLMTNSALHDGDGEDIVLVVTERAVKSCAGTWLPKYQAEVRAAIDVRMSAERSGARGDFYRGIEWFACWLLDHSEGETIEEELLRGWATEAWRARSLFRSSISMSDAPDMTPDSPETFEARSTPCAGSASGWWVDGAVHVAEIRELEERMRGLVGEYRAVLMLAHEMALELRMRCNEDIHHEQVAEIQRRMVAVGLTQNEKLCDSREDASSADSARLGRGGKTTL